MKSLKTIAVTLLAAVALAAGCTKPGLQPDAKPAAGAPAADQRAIAEAQAGTKQHNEERSKELKAQAEAILAKNPQDLNGQLLLGASALAKDDYEGAIKAYQKAAEMDPKSALPPGYIGNVYRMQQKWAEAETWYKKALALDPNWQVGYANLAVTYDLWGKPEEAAKAAEQGAKLFPNAVDLNLLAGNFFKTTGNTAKAKTYYQAAVKADPNNEHLKKLLAEVSK